MEKNKKMEIKKFKVMQPEEAEGQESLYLAYHILKGKSLNLPKPDVILCPIED